MPVHNHIIASCLAAVLLAGGCADRQVPVDPSTQSVYNTADVVDIDTTDISLMNTVVSSDGWHVFSLLSSCKVVTYDLKFGTRDTFLLTPAHGDVTWGGSLALDTSNALLMVMDNTANVVSVWDWKLKAPLLEAHDVAHAFLSPDGLSMLVQSKSVNTIRKVSIPGRSEELLPMPVTLTSTDVMLGVDWLREGIVLYSSYPLRTKVISFDGSTVLQTITWPSEVKKGTYACARGGDWATLCSDAVDGVAAQMIAYDLHTGDRMGMLKSAAAGSYPINMTLLGDKRAHISAQRTTSPALEPAIHSINDGSTLQNLSLAPDAERTARAWSVSQHDRYITAFLVKAPAATGVIRMWRVN